jgi:ATP-dependent helicase HrpA
MSQVISYAPDLPITEKRDDIIAAILAHQVLVVTGETGSGKSTQLPKMCLEAGRGVKGLIGSTQPRRIAAITLANRVAEELKGVGPAWVGYKIRFQDRTARTTRIKFMTDGILLAEAQKDRLFHAYDTLIIDEAHERTLNIDFILGLLKKILPRRPDLKVIVTSATLDPEKFSQAFDDAPIIEVSGRTYPVEVWHRPSEAQEEEDDAGYIDQAVAAVDLIKAGHDVGSRGDILIFMPTESDIRETVQRLEEKRYPQTLVLPLFGRLAAADQQRIFQLPPEEKIVVATNVAETSITIPRIRYVIDSGLSRISQYNPRSRTQSLPILPISRASADQRQGRCGRVAAGICIRLYAKDDYLARPLYTPPEILRSNLAEVILRMLFLRLGSIEDFPFLDPPSPAAIKDAFGILKELGAIDDHRRLTDIGRMMARLPLDPRLARMLIAARPQKALNEVVILVAVLSIQDPRERPLDVEQQADQMQARFRDQRSDFVTLLRIWQAFHRRPEASLAAESPPGLAASTFQSAPLEIPSPCVPENPPKSPFGKGGSGGILPPSVAQKADLQTPSQGQMRKFCREHFLSYRRMREWRDIHDEIWDILEELGGFERKTEPASYESLHRALLSGYLSHIARKKEKNSYLGTKNRQLMLFPGSGLFNRGGAWIMSAEQVQTTRLFARTSATIEPEWIEDLGKHLCRSVYFEPHWEKTRGQVVAYERVVLYGLTLVDRRKVSYGRIKPDEAREIFIRSGLVAGDLPGKHTFLEHNRELIARIADLENKARRRDLLVDEETIFRFYDQRVPHIADAASLNKLVKERGGDHFLRMTDTDLLETAPGLEIEEQFPDVLVVGDIRLPLRYAFHPGAEDDGITMTIPLHALPNLPAALCEWLVPGLLPEKVLLLLKALPKSLRRHLVPVATAAEQLLRGLTCQEGSLDARLSRGVFDFAGVRVPLEAWDHKGLPLHLRMRFEVVDPQGNVLGAGRDLTELRSLATDRHEGRMWEEARKTWEKTGLTSWDFTDLPERIVAGTDALGLAVHAYPGLAPEGLTAAIRLFTSQKAAQEASLNGLLLLYQWAFAAQLKQLKRTWKFPDDMAAMIFFMGNRQETTRSLQLYLLRELFELHVPRHPDHSHFQATEERLQGKISSFSMEMLNEIFEAVKERHAATECLNRLRKLAAKNEAALRQLSLLFEELDELVPGDFLNRFRRDQIKLLPRYLRAMKIRAERAYAAPEKDRLKIEQVTPLRIRFEHLKQEVMIRPNSARICFLDELRWMVEEFKVSLFAPEIKGRFRISLKRLEDKFAEWQALKDRE